MVDARFKKSVALIGAGRWGRNLARNLNSLGVLHTICDTSEAILDSYEKDYDGVRLTTNLHSVLSDSEVERVVIAAPAAMHYELVKESLLAKKDVYVEKPLCLDSLQGEELVELAKTKERVLMVGHILRYHPCLIRLQEMLGAGELGKLQYIVSNRLNLGSIRIQENALWDFAPHDVSIILSLCGQQLPQQVRCVGASYISNGIADISTTTLRFDRDVRAHIYVSWLNPFKERKLVVIGSAGMAVFDDIKPWDEKLVIYRNHINWKEGKTPCVEEREAENVVVPQDEPLRCECLHFLKCCDERLIPRTDGQEALQVLKVLQAAQASMDEEGEAKNPNEHHCLSGVISADVGLKHATL